MINAKIKNEKNVHGCFLGWMDRRLTLRVYKRR